MAGDPVYRSIEHALSSAFATEGRDFLHAGGSMAEMLGGSSRVRPVGELDAFERLAQAALTIAHIRATLSDAERDLIEAIYTRPNNRLLEDRKTEACWSDSLKLPATGLLCAIARGASMKKNVLSLISVALMLSVSACSTNSKGYKNPSFGNYHLTKTAVYVDNLGEVGDQLEAAVVEELNNDGVRAISVRGFARFAKNFEDFKKKVLAQDINEVLVIAMSDSSGANTLGYQSWGSDTANAYGSGNTVMAYGRSSSTSVPIISPHREMYTSVSIYNREADKIWTGNTERKARGLLFMGDSLTVSETVGALMDALKKDGLIH